MQEVKKGSAMLKREFEKVQKRLVKDYISLSDHEIVTDKLNKALAEAEEKAKIAFSKYVSSGGHW